MTEYDYSPEAYERHVRKQQAIARWVDDTSLYTPANPFIPLPEASSSIVYQPQDRGLDVNNGRSSSFRHPYSHGKDDGRRSRHSRPDQPRPRKHSAPTPASYIYSSQPAHGQGVQHQAPYGQGQYLHYSNATQRYTSPYGSSSRTPTASPPPRSASKSQPNQPVVLSIKDGKGGYLLSPHKGVNYQVVHPQNPPPASAAQPWYKRVFSSTADSNGGKNKMSKTHRDNTRRSKPRWSLDIY